MLAAMAVELQRQRRTRFHFDALDLETRRFLQHGVGTPGPQHGLVNAISVVPSRLELADNLLHPLHVITMGDQHGVGRVDDEEIIQTPGRDNAVGRVNVRVAGGDRHAFAASTVAFAIGCSEFREGTPRADVAPIESGAHHGYLARLFHHRDVE